jgi:hypothetical protein
MDLGSAFCRFPIKNLLHGFRFVGGAPSMKDMVVFGAGAGSIRLLTTF